MTMIVTLLASTIMAYWIARTRQKKQLLAARAQWSHDGR